jgi:serine/threonine-protein kinase
MLGTPYYMSPEQIEGDKDLDARTDIYALGVILYECAAGRRPYEAPQLPMLSVLIHEGKPTPLAELRPDLSQGFVDVIARAMAKERDARFRTARELGDALAHFGSSALGVTMEELAPGTPGLAAARRSVRISDRSVPPTTPTPAPTPRPAAMASVAGATVSVVEKRQSGRRGAVIAAVIVAVVGGVWFGARPDGASTTAPAGFVLPAATGLGSSAARPSASSEQPLQAPSSIPSVTTVTTGAPLPGASAPPAGASASAVATASPRTPLAAPKAAASTHAAQRGLAGENENPY